MITLKITLAEAAELHSTLTELMTSNTLPFKFGWKVDDVMESLLKPAQRFEKARQQLLEKYSDGEPTPGENGMMTYALKEPALFNKEFTEVADTPLEVELEEGFSFEELSSVPDLKLPGVSLKVIRKYLVTKEEQPVKEETQQDEKES